MLFSKTSGHPLGHLTVEMMVKNLHTKILSAKKSGIPIDCMLLFVFIILMEHCVESNNKIVRMGDLVLEDHSHQEIKHTYPPRLLIMELLFRLTNFIRKDIISDVKNLSNKGQMLIASTLLVPEPF